MFLSFDLSLWINICFNAESYNYLWWIKLIRVSQFFSWFECAAFAPDIFPGKILSFGHSSIPRHEDHVWLFFSFTSASGHPPLGAYTFSSITGVVSGATAAELLQCTVAGIPLHLARRLLRWWTGPHGSSSRHQSSIYLYIYIYIYLSCVLSTVFTVLMNEWMNDHITPLLRQLHWLKILRRTDYKLAVLVYKCRHCLAPSYLADELHHLTESEFRKRLRPASSHELSVPRTRLSTDSDQALPVAAVRIWNQWRVHRRRWGQSPPP